VVTAALGLARGRWLPPLGTPMAASVALALCFAFTLAQACSPVVIFPLIVLANAAVFVMHVSPRGRRRLTLACVAATTLPIVVEAITPMTIWRGDREWVLRPVMFGDLSLAMTAVIHATVIVFCCYILGTYRDRLRIADQRLQFQAWQLRQVVGDAPVKVED
jgi:hypothetical protein